MAGLTSAEIRHGPLSSMWCGGPVWCSLWLFREMPAVTLQNTGTWGSGADTHYYFFAFNFFKTRKEEKNLMTFREMPVVTLE